MLYTQSSKRNLVKRVRHTITRMLDNILCNCKQLPSTKRSDVCIVCMYLNTKRRRNSVKRLSFKFHLNFKNIEKY
jgi:hypothetical protein